MLDYTKISKLRIVSSIDEVNALLEGGWIMLGPDADGQFIMARVR